MKIYGRDKQHPKGYQNFRLPKGVRPWWVGEMGGHSRARGRREGTAEIIDQYETGRIVYDRHADLSCPICYLEYYGRPLPE